MSQTVRAFYNGDVEREWRRLDEPLGQLEFASTLRLVDNYFPQAGRVCDIGGGPSVGNTLRPCRWVNADANYRRRNIGARLYSGRLWMPARVASVHRRGS